ncbi:MAG: homoserine dehydrogenase [Albidovulum sp.]
MNMKTYDLAVIGFGNVGRGLAQLLIDKEKQLSLDPGIAIRITSVSDMFLGYASDPDGLDLQELLRLPNEKGALAQFSGGKPVADNEAAITAGHVDIVTELTFTNPKTGEPAITHCRLAKSHGKHAITTNKGPVALAGGRLRNDAQFDRLAFRYEGSVMSGTPVIRFAREALAGATISSFRGILNGTANYVLGQVEEGHSFDEAIKAAQELGYAEADPSADIGGSDVFAKVRILSGELFGYGCNIASEQVTGLENLAEKDVRAAPNTGKRWKLIGAGRLEDAGQVHLSVTPVLLPMSDPLAGLSGALNGVSFGTDVLGDVTVVGPGAGRIETAYALLSDILDIHRNSLSPCFAPILKGTR